MNIPQILPPTHRPLSKHTSGDEWKHQPVIRTAPSEDRDACLHRNTATTEAAPILGWKRALDLFWVLLILPVAMVLVPILFCWIKLASPGPILFRQKRVGRGGKPFIMYKFRTMKDGSTTDIHEVHVANLIKNNQPMAKLDHGDNRLIRGAYFIRMSGLDELPQLINVLRGEMSAIGPRPCVLSEFKFYEAEACRRFAVLPGLTGLWQVERTQSTTFDEMVEMDLKYVDRLSPWLDLKIILRTPVALLEQLAMRRTQKSDHGEAKLSYGAGGAGNR